MTMNKNQIQKALSEWEDKSGMKNAKQPEK